jgi:hypothetical protein
MLSEELLKDLNHFYQNGTIPENYTYMIPKRVKDYTIHNYFNDLIVSLYPRLWVIDDDTYSDIKHSKKSDESHIFDVIKRFICQYRCDAIQFDEYSTKELEYMSTHIQHELNMINLIHMELAKR